MKAVFNCATPEDTMRLGELFGARCRGGEVFELRSDLGGGKTTLTRGIALGLGSDDEVSSPSFTINNRYVGKKLTLEHFDFYRLADAGIMSDELSESLGYQDGVVVVEWADVVSMVLPSTRIVIDMRVNQDDSRTLDVTFEEESAYMIEGAGL